MRRHDRRVPLGGDLRREPRLEPRLVLKGALVLTESWVEAAPPDRREFAVRVAQHIGTEVEFFSRGVERTLFRPTRPNANVGGYAPVGPSRAGIRLVGRGRPLPAASFSPYAIMPNGGVPIHMVLTPKDGGDALVLYCRGGVLKIVAREAWEATGAAAPTLAVFSRDEAGALAWFLQYWLGEGALRPGYQMGTAIDATFAF